MLKKTLGSALYRPWRTIASRRMFSGTVDSYILRSLKELYLEVSRMEPPPKVSLPSEFTFLKGADGPVLKRTYNGKEEISISMERLDSLIPDDQISQVFVNVEVRKHGHKNRLQLLCGLDPDHFGIYSVVLAPKEQTLDLLQEDDVYRGPDFEGASEHMRDTFHDYLEERGINEKLFPFLQAWLCVKDQRNLSKWFQSVGKAINQGRSSKDS